ncbi:hypothetical protein F5J12DRAFT_198989 [Pisolithus orientalis]|uniref:uncharacterized protein n=1 Tax=Pisolithus orientalis TaxID=936130 RepID=UPI002224E14B|nr:uncharacterized protein F5J12DRAFT_198989 [Pisolithus orientalis]KAI6033137.1 hypothetical protein F5J12DRAFT_198989 [Pisolithus orientalis]
MRKTSYALTFIAVIPLLIFNILSARLPDWLVATHTVDDTRVTVRYGLMERCERITFEAPDPSNVTHSDYSGYECRHFPLREQDKCETENKIFCAAWVSAQYFTELGIGFAATALVTLLFGVSTHSRRRRVWRAVAGLVVLHAVFQLTTFILVAELYRMNRFPGFDHAKPGSGFVLNAVSWLVGFGVAYGVIYTGVAADRGYRWAAGNRYYYSIHG